MDFDATTLSRCARFALIASTAGMMWFGSTSGPALAAPEIGAAAPALIVNAFKGTTFDLARLRGKVVLVVELLGDMVRTVPQGNAETRRLL